MMAITTQKLENVVRILKGKVTKGLNLTGPG
jgi:hypothetical protein